MNCQKEHFFTDPSVTYLNGSYMSPQLKVVESAGIQALQKKNQPWNILPGDFFYESERLKKLFARLIHIDTDERIAIIPSVSYGITNAARNIQFKPGDRIVLLEKQFPSNYYIWHELAKQHQLDLHIVRIPTTLKQRGKSWNELLLQSINHRTRLVSIEQVHWTDGTLFDLIPVGERARDVGSLLIIDATQSLGILDFDQSQIKADAVIAASYKWLLGPYSIGCAYYGPAFDHGDPIEASWMNKNGSEVFEDLLKYEPVYKPGAARYNMGEQSQFIQVPMLARALTQILEWGVGPMQHYCKRLVDQVLPAIEKQGLWIEDEGFRANHLFGIRAPQGLKAGLKQALLDQKIYVSCRDDAIRVSPNVYNSADDLNVLVEAIAAYTST
ncbi:MAG: aminotransferase class V-fold PLP-dependent enzyme [Saprospiraceae bacterium]|nr:aminotransferase class V-fold PLP-dependent enzyme [Saprospiraceae bacterium]